LEGLAKDAVGFCADFLLHQWGKRLENGKYKATPKFREAELVVIHRYERHAQRLSLLKKFYANAVCALA
jgi:hypothetical protein